MEELIEKYENMLQELKHDIEIAKYKNQELLIHILTARVVTLEEVILDLIKATKE